jgi:undecaprenyl-phosphate 4-deoxy-4-formamido-L-arabinose transferase
MTLATLTERLAVVLPRIASTYEVVFVNDGSVDDSWAAIEALSRNHPWVRGTNLLRNYGQHNALLCGIRSARYDAIATMDDDLQNPPEELPTLVGRLTRDVQVVYGTPASPPHGVWRTVASRVTRLALAVAIGVERARMVSTFRLFRTEIRDAFADYRSPVVSVDVLLTWGAQHFTSVEVASSARPEGRSNYRFWQLVGIALNMATGFSVLPLRLASIVGFAFTALGFAVLAYVVARYVASGGSVPGFPFLASIIAIFSGAQLFALGIIGEYLGRTYDRTMDRPAYVIRSSAPTGPRFPAAGTERHIDV